MNKRQTSGLPVCHGVLSVFILIIGMFDMDEVAMMTVLVSVDNKASVCGYVIVWGCDGPVNMEHKWFFFYGKLVAGILFFPFTYSDLIVLILYYIHVFCTIDRISRPNRCYIRLNTADSELEILSLLYREMIR